MAIQVLTRPEKTLSNGFLSKWNSSELPLRYKFESDLFPINKISQNRTITNVVYDPSKQGTVLTLTTNNYDNLEFVTVSGTGIDSLDGGNFQIKQSSGNEIVLDTYTDETSSTGNTVKYYRNYIGLVKVFAGAREGHPYDQDGSKPLQEIGVIEVDFLEESGDNFGYADVKTLIKPDVNADFDYNDENRHFGWTSFYVQTAESYDDVVGGSVQNVTTTFEDDKYDNCVPFLGYEDPSFDNGLTDWLTNGTSFFTESWNAGVGNATTSVTQNTTAGFIGSRILYQNITLINNNSYVFNIDVIYSGDANSCKLLITDSTGDNVLGQIVVGSSGVYNISVTTNTDVTGVGLVVTGINELNKTVNIQLNNFQSTYNGSPESICKAFSYSVYGCKQFQDSLGGNFGDYVLNIEDTITPKILTHFNELSYFYGKPFYLNAIIPSSTFSLSDGADNLFVSLEFFDNQDNSLLNYNYQVANLKDGVYTIDPNIKNELDSNNIGKNSWSYANARFIIIPSNTFVDGNNGTFEGLGGLGGIIMLPYTVVTPNQAGNDKFLRDFGRVSSNCMQVQISAPSMNELNKTYSIFTHASSINVVEGREYEINAYVSIENGQIDPRHINNGSIYFLPNGYTENECSVTKKLIKYDWLYQTSEPVTEDWQKLTTVFTAKTTESIRITFYEDIVFDITSTTGGDINIDNLTFKGPIDFISEIKTIKNNYSCSHYGVTLRWLNDLGGWEQWYFDSKSVYSENVTQKVNIKKDITSNWDNTYINGDTQNDNIKTNSNKSILVRSQLLTKNEQEVIQQLRRSVKVQMLMDSEKWQTVTINKGKFVVNKEGDKTRDISFDIQLPDILVQEQ